MSCQLLRPDEESTSTQRYIDSRTVQLKAKGAWISVEVTETIKDWVSDPGQIQQRQVIYSVCELHFHQLILLSLSPLHWSENNLGLKLGVHCPCCTFVPSTNNIVPNKSEELEALFAGLFFFVFTAYHVSKVLVLVYICMCMIRAAQTSKCIYILSQGKLFAALTETCLISCSRQVVSSPT